MINRLFNAWKINYKLINNYQMSYMFIIVKHSLTIKKKDQKHKTKYTWN